MTWKIEFFEDRTGKIPVHEFLYGISAKERAKVVWIIDLLERTGLNLHEPYTKHIEGPIWELRPQDIRILYFLHKKTFVLLHGFKKKTQKTPKSEINIAIKRMEAI